MDDQTVSEPFRLSRGGIFYRLMLRTRLVEEDRYHEWRGIAVLVGLTWLPLSILATLAGALSGSDIGLPFFSDPGPYAKYLFALPLLIAADRIIDPLVALVVNHIEVSGVLPEEARPRYRAALTEMTRRRDSVWVEAVFIILALSLSCALILGYGDIGLEEGVSSWAWTVTGQKHRPKPAGWWYLLISGPFLQFLIYRWFWRLVIWFGFLYRVSRIRLALRATHSDLAGGLGILSTGQNAFVVLFVAIAAVLSSELANDILFEGCTLTELRMEIIGFVILCVAVIVGPLFFFLGTLKKAKQRGLQQYEPLGYQLSKTFHAKWIRGVSLEQKGELMDTADPSAIADFSAAYDNVSSMRLVALNQRSTILLAAILLAPFLPLALTEFSFTEALKRIGEMLV